MQKRLRKLIETIIFSCKWLLIAAYVKLIVTLAEVIYLFILHESLTQDQLIHTLEAVDMVMIANLVKQIITGSYNSFVSKEHGRHGENISSGALKVKMSTSLIGISSIFLLQVFLKVNSHTEWAVVWKYVVIHSTFLVSAIILAIVEFLHVKSEWYEADMQSRQGDEIEEEDDLIIDMHDSPDRGKN